MKIKLPDTVRTVAVARKSLCDEYAGSGLSFTPDGKFVGDLGEAIAAKVFGITLKQGTHIDGISRCNKPVQIKASGRKNGAIYFRPTDFADASNVHLIAIFIDWEECEAEIIYNGPEVNVRPSFEPKEGQKGVSLSRLARENARLNDSQKLSPDPQYVLEN